MKTKTQRKRNSKVYTDILLKSGRRCCLCFGLKNDHAEKRGQIAHLDHNASNDEPDNLAFLCLEHHDQYDSKTSESKSLQINEVKAHREHLYQFVSSKKLVSAEAHKKIEKEGTQSKPLSARALNAYLVDRPHKCSYCGYSFSLMPKLEEGKNYFVKAAICPRCGNIDEVLRFYQG